MLNFLPDSSDAPILCYDLFSFIEGYGAYGASSKRTGQTAGLGMVHPVVRQNACC